PASLRPRALVGAAAARLAAVLAAPVGARPVAVLEVGAEQRLGRIVQVAAAGGGGLRSEPAATVARDALGMCARKDLRRAQALAREPAASRTRLRAARIGAGRRRWPGAVGRRPAGRMAVGGIVVLVRAALAEPGSARALVEFARHVRMVLAPRSIVAVAHGISFSGRRSIRPARPCPHRAPS